MENKNSKEIKVEKTDEGEQNLKKSKNAEVWRFIKFLLFSISAGVIQFGSFTLMFEVFKWAWWPSYLVSVILSVVWNFTFNRKFTFKSANNVPKAMALALLFYVFFIPASVYGGNYLKEDLYWNGFIVEALMMILNFLLEFPWQRFVVFRKSINSADNKNSTDSVNENGEKEKFQGKLGQINYDAIKSDLECLEKSKKMQSSHQVMPKTSANVGRTVTSIKEVQTPQEHTKVAAPAPAPVKTKTKPSKKLGQINYDSISKELAELEKLRRSGK